jgi:hypothetical protein
MENREEKNDRKHTNEAIETLHVYLLGQIPHDTKAVECVQHSDYISEMSN